jgi:hypothetical protein
LRFAEIILIDAQEYLLAGNNIIVGTVAIGREFASDGD